MDIKTSKDLAKDLDSSRMIIDCFIRSCSHEMKGPLASIQGLTDVARYNTNDREVINCLDLIKCTAAGMKELIHTLEAFMIHTQRDLDHDEVNVSGMVGMILHELDPEIQRRQIRINTQIKQPSRWVSDLVCNQLILKNLICNSIQFADPVKKLQCIDINIHSGSKNVVIEVIDNGVGINQEEQAKIGKPFFRASHQSRGMGLGLFLVKKLSEKLGASFALHSREGEGTTCAIEVPNLSCA